MNCQKNLKFTTQKKVIKLFFVFFCCCKLDYAIACASLSVAAAGIAIILIWITGIHMCLKGKMDQHHVIRLRTSEILIAGTLLTSKL